jgi:hypothetical protein
MDVQFWGTVQLTLLREDVTAPTIWDTAPGLLSVSADESADDVAEAKAEVLTGGYTDTVVEAVAVAP